MPIEPDSGPPVSGLTPENEAKVLAGVHLIGRTGATNVQIRFSDEETPVVWMAVAIYESGAEADGGLDPVTALMRLCERLVDGGECKHCHKPTAFYEDLIEVPTLLGQTLCIYMWDPELKTFRRGCEGE